MDNEETNSDIEEYLINDNQNNKKKSKKKKQKKKKEPKKETIIEDEMDQTLNNIQVSSTINQKGIQLNNSMNKKKTQEKSIDKTINENKIPESIKEYQMYQYIQPFNIDNIFKLNQKFNIPIPEPCIYILNPYLPSYCYTPISTKQVKDLYLSEQLKENITQFRPFDMLKFKGLANYTFVNFKLIDNQDWVDNIELNTKMECLFSQRIKEEKKKPIKNNESTLIFNESFIQNLNNESIAIFNEKASKLIEKEQNNGLEIINESGEWKVIDKKRNKKRYQQINNKMNIKEEPKVVGLDPKKVKKQNNEQNKEEDILELLRPKKYVQSETTYKKFITAFGQNFTIDYKDK